MAILSWYTSPVVPFNDIQSPSLNDFSKPFHHGQTATTITPDDNTLSPQVERAIRFIQGKSSMS